VTQATGPDALQKVTREELRRFQRRRRLAVAALAALSLAPILGAAPLIPRSSLAGVVLHAAGLACVALGVFIRAWAAVHVGGRKQRELVTSGPYALVRNPLYVGTLFAAFGIGLAFGSIAIALLLAVLAFLVFDWIVKLEERRLRDEFGAEAFDAYLASTPRWLPAFRALPPEGRMETDAGVVLRTLAQALIFFAGFALAHALEALRLAGALKPLFLLP
jgi:protein-S-isoprenylcysteine O-methyltransferase Ste14